MGWTRAFVGVVIVCFALTGCGSLRFVDVPAEIQTERIDHLVIHFTGENFAESMRLLSERTEAPVSVHYVVPESDDTSYSRQQLRVHRLVDEERRAWHAGQSYWRGVTSLNARSIGVEIVNTSQCEVVDASIRESTPENQRCEFLDYDPEQLELVVDLVLDILARHPGIDPEDIVGHADVAPARRVDPGPKFPWRDFYELGIGAWPDADTVARYVHRFETNPPDIGLVQRALASYGYEVEPTGLLDSQTRFALRAFQMHFRPVDYAGTPDNETAAIIFALIEKYRPRALNELAQ